jgi:hypothetical protein
MAKAQLTTKSGTTITIEGTLDEVAKLISQFEGPQSKKRTASKQRKQTQPAKDGIVDLLLAQIEEGFFKKPKELGVVKTQLQEGGHYYPNSTIAPQLLRFVRRRTLRRIKVNKRWAYVG